MSNRSRGQRQKMEKQWARERKAKRDAAEKAWKVAAEAAKQAPKP